ncbi:MAG: 4Fe-4S dicluster domain-containing protein [Promethearchaeota archaeon]
MKQIGFYFDQTRCIGCFTCSIACKDWHDIPAGPINRIRLTEIEKGTYPNLFLTYLALACNHCVDPPCVKACPVGAITKREEDGIVIVNSKKCIGKEQCGAKCLKVCPWDAPQFGPEDNDKMDKCDLCLDRIEQGQQTICVEACPMYALDVGPINKLREKYGNNVDAEGFNYSEKYKPSIVFKPRFYSNKKKV